MMATSLRSDAVGSATGNPRNKVALKPGHSLMDWVRLGNSGVDLTGVGGIPQEVTPQQLAAHSKKTDAWIAIRGKVFNVTRYMDFHPGGDAELMRGIGQDATDLFNQVHAWVNYESLLQKCFVGRLVRVEKCSGASKASTFVRKLFPRKAVLQEKAVTMDWYQTASSVSLQFFTKGGSPQTRVILHTNHKDLFVNVMLEGTVHVTHLLLEDDVLWPCKVKTAMESGKVEVLFSKRKPAMWPALGCHQDDSGQKRDASFIQYDPLEVMSVEPITHNTVLIKLRHKQRIFDTIPIGYSVKVRADLDGEEVVRNYTPVVAALDADWGGNCLCLMVKQYPHGIMSRYLCGLKLHDVLMVSQPVGSLQSSLLAGATRLYLLAAGTGFTPMVQLIMWALGTSTKTKFQKVSLVFFNVATKDILWREQLDKLAATDTRFSVIYVLSEPDDDWAGLSGRLSMELLQDLVPSATNQKKCDSFVFVCGPVPFNESAAMILGELGYSEKMYYVFKG